MSLATARASEVIGRNVVHKPIAGHHIHAHAAVQAAEGSHCDDALYRDASPHVRGAPAYHESLEDDQAAFVQPAVAEGAEPQFGAPAARTAVARRAGCPALPLDLDVLPSFSEQRPQGAKPLFLDRHDTLQRVYQSQQEQLEAPRGSGSGATPRAGGGGGGDAAVVAADDAVPASNRPLASCLPSWDVARSELWLLTEAVLSKVRPPQGAGGNADAEGEADQLSDLRSFPAAAARRTLERPPSVCVRTPSATPFACRNTQVSITQQAPGLGGLFRQMSSLRRECPPTPRGLGPLPSLLTPSFTLSSLAARPVGAQSDRSAAAAADADAAADAPPALALEAEWEAFVVPDPGQLDAAALPAPAAREDGRSDSSRHHPKHHVAFAAGVAAATSTAAAVSHAAAAAAAGLAGVLSQPSISSAAGALVHIGGAVLNVGSGVLVPKIQSAAMSKSTMTAAEVVLGSDAPEAAREQLRQRLRCALAGVSVGWFLLNLQSTTDVLAHLDFQHDFVTSSKVVLNLATTGPSLLKNCQELLQVGLAVTVGVGKRVMGAEAD